MTSSIPVWVDNEQRWVSGVDRKTTCEDVINVLLLRGDGSSIAAADSKGQCFAIMERWRRMERPLDGRSRILKVWHAWGDNQSEVKLTLRQIDGEADSGRGSPSRESNQVHRRRKHRNKLPWPSYEALHPRRLAQMHQTDGHKLPESIQRLMKLILAQGETIQSQLKKLQDREHQIEYIEDETHRSRVETLGSNYLLETYLGSVHLGVDEEKEHDSGVTEGGSDQTSPISSDNNVRHRKRKGEGEEKTFGDELDTGTKDLDMSTIDDNAIKDLQMKIDLLEKLSSVNRRLEREEESLVRVHIKFERYSKKRIEKNGQMKDDDAERCFQEKQMLLKDLDVVRDDLEKGARTLESISLSLLESEALLDARHHYLRRLLTELEAADRDTLRLEVELVKTQQQCATSDSVVVLRQVVVKDNAANSVPKSILKRTTHDVITTVAVIHNDTDSNSDTGLSSLHSSSEEGVYTLDTLV